MIAVEKDQEGTAGRRHHQQPTIRETVWLEPSSAVMGPDSVNVILRAAVKNTKVEVAAGIVNSPVITICIEDAMNNKVGEGEEKSGDAIRVGSEFITFQQGIENKVGIGQGCFRSEVSRGDGPRIG